MTDPKLPEETAGGQLGKLAGKAKEAAGSVLGNEDLAREGRLQQAQVEAPEHAAAEAQQREAEAEVEAAKADNELERERLQTEPRINSHVAGNKQSQWWGRATKRGR